MKLQEVKKHFENAEFVETTTNKEKRKVNLNSLIIDCDGDVWCKEEETNYNFFIWNTIDGFAKILTTKEKSFSITKDQILKLENGFTTDNLYKWFPEAFEVPLIIGKWYKSSSNDLYCVSGFKRAEVLAYGFEDGKWLNDGVFHISFAEKDKESTKQEVFEALKNEAVNRGFVEGAYYKNTDGDIYVVDRLKEYSGYDLVSKYGDGMIFKGGEWASIIPTITKQEAEELLNKKII